MSGLLIAGCLIACGAGEVQMAARHVVELETFAAQGAPETEQRAREVLAEQGTPQEVRCTAWYAMGRLRGRQERYAEGLEWLHRVGAHCASEPRISAEALWELASWSRFLSPTTRERVLERIVTAFPDEPAAARAVREMAPQSLEGKALDAYTERMARLYRQVEGTQVAPVLLFEAAWLLAKENDPSRRLQALGLYQMIVGRYPDSALRDDALWEQGRILLEMGAYQSALECFLELRGLREWSFLFGSYERPLYQQALLGIARAQQRLGRYGEAAEALEALARECPGKSAELLERAAQLRRPAGERTRGEGVILDKEDAWKVRCGVR